MGRPPLPECPIEAVKNGKEPKQPCYFNGRGVIPISWKQWQKEQPIKEIYRAWFANPKTGIGTLGGWNGKHWLGWVDFDQKDFSSADECDRSIDQWVKQYSIMVEAPMFRSPRGGYRFLVAFSQEPQNFKANSGFSLNPDGSHHVGELLTKNGGHTLLPPTIGVNGKPYQWVHWSEYPPVVEQPEDVGLYPVLKRTENNPIATVQALQGNSSNKTDTSLIEFLKRDVYPRLTADVAFCWSGHDFKTCGNKLKGNCPWHDSQSGTAFYIDRKDDQFLWRCPACNIGGSVIEYRHRLAGGNGSPRGKDFVDVVRQLADDVGGSLPLLQRDRTFKVVPHQTVIQTNGNENYPKQPDKPYELVKTLVCSGMSKAQLSGALIELSTSTGYNLGGLKDLARDIEADLSLQSAQPDDTKETNKLLEYREQTLDLRRVFPPRLANYLLTKATSDRVDPVFIYQYLWSAIGLSLGAHIGIKGKEGQSLADSWVEFPIYYNMTVAPPSSGKSQTMRSVLGPIKRKQDRQRAEYRKAQKHLKNLKEEWNNKSAEDKERLKDSESNPIVYQGQMPKAPQVQMIEAGSPEGAFKRISELPAMSGCALAFDELIRILLLDQYKNQGGDTRQTLMEAWNHPYSTEFLRSDDKNTLSLNKICINVTGGIQPAKAKKLLSDPDDGDGLLSRFLIAQTKIPDDFAVWSSTQVDIDRALSELYQFLEQLHYGLRKKNYGDDYIQSIVDGEQIILQFDTAAQKRWQQWWEHVRQQMLKVEYENPALCGYLGKMHSQTLRIALGLHCIELMYEDKADPLTIGLPTLERAIYAIKFHIGQFRLLQVNNDTSSLPGVLSKIHEYALRKSQPVSAVQVQKTVFRRCDKKPSLCQIRDYFEQLVNANAAQVVGEGKDLKILANVVITTKSDKDYDTTKRAVTDNSKKLKELNQLDYDNYDNFLNSPEPQTDNDVGEKDGVKTKPKQSFPENPIAQSTKVGGQEQKISETVNGQILLSAPISPPNSQTSNNLYTSKLGSIERPPDYELPPDEERF